MLQQTFQCNRCGAQNYMGQPTCWNCRTPFQWTCYKCGAIADTQFLNCTNCGSDFPWYTPPLQEPSLHILIIDPIDKKIVGAVIKGNTNILLPAITTDGRISTLTIDNENNFIKLQNDVLYKINTEWKHCNTHFCAAVNYVHPKNPHAGILIYHVTGIIEFIPEMEETYSVLSTLAIMPKGNAYWTKMSTYFGTEPIKSWINGLIIALRQTLNWNEMVYKQLAALQ